MTATDTQLTNTATTMARRQNKESAVRRIAGAAVFAAVLLPLPVPAQNTLTAPLNMMRGGDILHKRQIAAPDPGFDGNNAVWDFRNVETVRKDYRVEHRLAPDSSLYCLEPPFMCRYRLEGGSLLLTNYQTTVTNINFAEPVLEMKYPMKYGDASSSSYSGAGKYANRNAVEAYGTVSITADGQGILICPDGDTLKNVLRVHTVRTASLGMDRDTVMGSGAERLVEIEEFYRWYARGCRYPVLETRSASYYHNTDFVKSVRTAFMCLPDSQRTLSDSANLAVARADSAAAGNAAGDIIEYSVENSGNVVTLRYSLSGKARVQALVCGIMGEVWRKAGRTDEAGGDYTLVLDCNGLRRGDYILYINVNGKAYSSKVALS